LTTVNEILPNTYKKSQLPLTRSVILLDLNDLNVIVSGDALDGQWSQEDVLKASLLLRVADDLERKEAASVKKTELDLI